MSEGTAPADVAAVEQRLTALAQALEQALAQAQDGAALERVRTTYLGRKGSLQELWQAMPQVPPEQRPRLGQLLNTAKAQWTSAVELRNQALQIAGGLMEQWRAYPDRTMPGHPSVIGHAHLIPRTIDEIVEVFEHLGFTVVEGPEIELPEHNFDALNIPPDHPSRESFDTFFLKTPAESPELLLRSHTSPMQVRYLKTHEPPLRIVVPGRVFRPDAVDASHCFQFHQIEGLVVEPDVTFADLKGLLTEFARRIFGPETRMRFRPHFFPFTEPSAEVDISCIFCRGRGCRVCGQKGWLEILGAGMVHPHVFKATGHPATLQGLAFGLGIERIAMLKYGIDDIRLFFENDVRFLHQF